MKKEKQEMLEELKAIRKTAEKDIKKNHPGYEDCEITDVIHYNKPVELVNRKTRKKEEFDLCVAIAEDPESGESWEMYYLDGKEVDFTELMREYESATPIKDVIDATKENEEKPEEEQDEELTTDNLYELEEENNIDKENNDANEELEKEGEEENDLTGTKPKYVIQTINVNNTYIDNWTTVSKGFNLPPQVKEIAIAKPMQSDENILSYDMTIYMLDDKGRIIEDIDGKTIEDFFEIDRATGKNPMNDENTKIELEGNAKRDKTHTMRRFRSKENPEFYLSAEQKKTGEYVQLYAGRKTFEENKPVEVQLETRNVPVQTSLEMQKIVDGHKGLYNTDNIDKKVDEYEEKGEDLENIPIENVAGEENEEEYERFRRGPWDK